MYIIEEINEWFPLHIPKLKFGYKVHKDNQYCIKMATGFFSPMTNQIALKYHHFITHVKYGWVEIQYKQTNEKLADILTKPLWNWALFTLRCMLFGWVYYQNKSISDSLQSCFHRYGCFVTRECKYTGLIGIVFYIRDSQLALLLALIAYDGVSHTSTSIKTKYQRSNGLI